MSSSKQRIVHIIDNLASYNNDDVQIYGDCESFDWWRTIGVGRFLISIVVVSAFYLCKNCCLKYSKRKLHK